ncbi:MAG: Snf7 family protein [Promethearchaeota archaeon]
MKKLFPKKKSRVKDSISADLKVAVNKIRMSIKKYERTAKEFQIKAKQAVMDGNIKLAKNYLLRRKRALNNLEKFQGFIIKLERQQDAIESAETIKLMGQKMRETTQELRKQVEELKPEEIMELNEESEEAIANIEESAEIMSESLETYDDMDIENDLEALKTEIMLDQEAGLPSVSISEQLQDNFEEEIDDSSKADAIKKELEKLQKELDI